MRHTLDLATCGRCLKFYSVSYVPHRIDRHEQAALDSPSWETDHAKRVRRRPVDSKRVNVDNLSETLEAHRAHNRASIIRKIKLPHEPYYQVYRPLFQSSRNSDEGRVKNGKGESRQEESESGIRLGSSDRVQDQRNGADREQNDSPPGHKNKKTEPSKTLEYVGKALDPIGTWRLNTESKSILQRPWLAYLKDSSSDRFLRLSNEIRAYEEYMRFTRAENTAAQLVVSKVRSTTRVPLAMMGSRNTGLATSISDFDFRLSLPPSMFASTESLARKIGMKSLRRLGQKFRSTTDFKNISLFGARVPILQAEHCATGLKIQIQTNLKPTNDFFTVGYLNGLPSLRPLFIILHYFLEIRGLSKTNEGGLGSYSLLMVIVVALKQLRGNIVTDDLAGQLLYVLRFLGDADTYRWGFVVDPPHLFDLKELDSISGSKELLHDSQLKRIKDIIRQRDPRRPYLLSLQDPANHSNDLGKNTRAIKHIQETFKAARKSLWNVLNQSEHDDSVDGFSCLDCLVRADYRTFEANRSRVERTVDLQESQDNDYSQHRIEADFLRRVESYKDSDKSRITNSSNNVIADSSDLGSD